ncbi:MAG: CHASE2 domain-containing protein, partial [Armatimonadetes bacterium]|nr:CHASE2 domain-containing protein [Armatimonadota bacterium]
MGSVFSLLLRFKSGIWPGIVCALLIWLCVGLGWTRGLERLTLDALFRARGPRDADPRIVVVAVDDATVVRAGERGAAGWPLPRRYYARAIERLHQMGAKTVAFDVLLAEPGPNLSEDRELARQCGAAGNIALACAFQVAQRRIELASDIEAAKIPARFALEDEPSLRVRDAIWATAPLPALSSRAATLGHLNVFPEPSGPMRRVPHLLRWRGQLFPSLSLSAAAHFLEQKPAINGPKAQISLAGRHIPLDREGLTAVNWIGAGGAYPTFGLNQLLDGNVPPDAIRGRLVVLGVTALGAFENRSTPFSGGVPAVDFQANAMDDILSNRILKSAAAPYALLLLLGFPIACALVTARRVTVGIWLVPAMMGVVIAVAVWLLSRDIYLPIAAPLAGGALSFAATAAAGYKREWESNTRADASVASLARGTTLLGAALSASGRDRDRLLGIIRDTARETLGAREVFLVLDDTPTHQPHVDLAAARARGLGAGWIWPPANSKKRATHLDNGEIAISNGETIVAAPLPRPVEEAATPNGALPRQFYGALVGIGRSDGGNFTPRDAQLLETLAEGASLALENWNYAERLRGRIESADRELEGAYQMLSEQSAKLFAAVESIEAALVVCDAHGLAVFINAATERVLHDATPALGEPVAASLAAGDLKELCDWFQDLHCQGTRAGQARLETTRAGEVLAAQFTPLISEDGHLIGALLAVADVTVQRELDRMKTDFVGYVAHELRTPLTTILGYASLLDMSVGRFSPEQMRDMTGTISRHCRRMNSLISDLLDISRLESGAPLPIRLSPFDLAELGERLIAEQKTYLNPTPPLELVFDCPQRPLEIWADAERMEQVLINLLSNAVKYSPQGGTITLVLRQTPEGATIEVSDQGMGLTQEQLSRLFGKFYRTDEARSSGIKGTGLGL